MVLLSTIRFAKSKRVLVLLESLAGSGVKLVKPRLRTDDKMTMLAWDRIVKQFVLFKERKKIKSIN